jgi:hypothetical protein
VRDIRFDLTRDQSRVCRDFEGELLILLLGTLVHES